MVKEKLYWTKLILDETKDIGHDIWLQSFTQFMKGDPSEGWGASATILVDPDKRDLLHHLSPFHNCLFIPIKLSHHYVYAEMVTYCFAPVTDFPSDVSLKKCHYTIPLKAAQQSMIGFFGLEYGSTYVLKLTFDIREHVEDIDEKDFDPLTFESWFGSTI